MGRWFFVVLGASVGIAILGVAAVLSLALWHIAEDGVAVRLEGPILVQGQPQEGKVEVALQGPVEVRLQGESPLKFEAALQGSLLPSCQGKLFLPVRWNPITGEITWRCIEPKD